VRVASAAPHGGFGAKAELAPDGAVSDLAIARDGTAIVVWSALADEEPRGVVAALRPAGAAAFAASEAVSPVEGSYQAAVAFDPRTNHPVVAWTGTPAGGTSEALRVAERTG